MFNNQKSHSHSQKISHVQAQKGLGSRQIKTSETCVTKTRISETTISKSFQRIGPTVHFMGTCCYTSRRRKTLEAANKPQRPTTQRPGSQRPSSQRTFKEPTSQRTFKESGRPSSSWEPAATRPDGERSWKPANKKPQRPASQRPGSQRTFKEPTSQRTFKDSDQSSTSWEPVAKWYKDLVGSDGHYFHQRIILPGVLK